MNDLVLPLCSPDYLEQFHGQPDPERLKGAQLIDSVKTIYCWDLWLATNRIELDELTYPFRFDRLSTAIEMAKQGGGIALDSAMLCVSELERDALVPFMPSIPVIEFPAYWFVCPPRHLNRRIVSRFADWIDSEANAHVTRARTTLEKMGCRFAKATRPEFLESAIPSVSE